MSNAPLNRHILWPLAGIIVAALIFILPGTNSASYDDIKAISVSSASGNSAILTGYNDVSAFMGWISEVVPESDVNYVEENPSLISPSAEISAVVEAETSYMYIYAKNGALYFNGIPFEMTVQDADNFLAFSEIRAE